MTDFLNQIVTFIGDNPGIAGFICFAAAMGEALFIVGLFVPSTVVLVGAGTLIGLGKLDGWTIFVWTTLGAIAGDAISYWVGYVYKDRLRNIWPLSRYTIIMDRGEAFFERHGGKSVFIGRFVPGVKSVVPGIAGMVGMNAWRFTFVNVTSAIAWTASHIAPGILAGTALSALGEVSGRLALVAGALLLVLFLAIMLGRWLILIIIPLFPGAHAAFANWFARRPGRLSQWVGRTFDPAHPRSTGMLASALLLLVTIPAFLWLMGEISPGEPMVRADVAILNMFESLRTPTGDHIMITITMLGDGIVVTVLTLVVACYLFARKAWRRGTGFLIAMASTALFVPVIKLLLHRSRPMDLYTGADAFSFPSGHTTLITVLFGICAVLVAHDRSRWSKAGIFTIAAIFIISIGFSRVYLGAHWMSDVLAGFLFGTAMVAAFGFVFGPIHNEKVGRWTLAGLVTGTLATFGAWHVSSDFNTAAAAYAPRIEREVITRKAWEGQAWLELPRNRIELNGEIEEPLIIQYAGPPDSLVHALAASGWTPAPKWSLSSAAGFVVGETPAEALPVLPRTHNGLPPDLVLMKEDREPTPNQGRWVLRLWPTRFDLMDGGRRLEIHAGSVVHESIVRPMGEFSGPRTDRDMPDAINNPALTLPGALTRIRPDGRTVVLAVSPAQAQGINRSAEPAASVPVQ
ncbi:membrane protein [Roseibium aquae]|uniref:Membrane protein n=1 Tax=Roseibium aquae TaxID=1323746 RepID=A0A916TMY8_9HYPH|nr:bifunctional DedA family/phosphatase PAP2 family protein [Roseibium aquae]GGB60973.1 membrane protein [Roseibium aquae]